MATEKTIVKGAIEDHLGRVLHPDTEADLVIRPNGETAEAAFQRLMALFINYLPMTGGTLSGPLGTDKTITVNQWGGISAGTDGTVVFGENCYKHPTSNTFHFARTHESMGARGIVFQNSQPGIWWFDTGHRATTADEAFVPNSAPLTKQPTALVTSIDTIADNTVVDCNDVPNGPGADWYYIETICHSNDPQQYRTQIAYAFHSTDVKRRRMSAGVWSQWEPFLTQSNTPAQYYATWEPLATDGKDGDVWDVYV